MPVTVRPEAAHLQGPVLKQIYGEQLIEGVWSRS